MQFTQNALPGSPSSLHQISWSALPQMVSEMIEVAVTVLRPKPQSAGRVVLDDDALRFGGMAAEVVRHAVRLAAVGGVEVVIAGGRVAAAARAAR